MHLQHTLTDTDGDRARFMSTNGGKVFVTVDTDGDRPLTAGGFTRAQLVEALDAVAPAGNSTGPHVRHEAPARDDYPRGGPVPIPEAFRNSTAEASERLRLGRLVEGVRDDGHTVQVGRVKITPCDTDGRTRDEVAAAVAAAARAEGRVTQVEAERDELREALAREVARGNALQDERDATESRPLTPDAITDEMVERGFKRLAQLDNSGISLRSTWAARQVLETVLIPGRPGGAEGWDEELGEMPAAQDLTPEQRTRLADALAERDHALGVRVATEDGAA